MSSILPANRTVELLETLKKTVEDFAARADKLNEEFKLQTAREQRRFETSLEQQTSEKTAATVQENAAFDAAKTRAAAIFEQRKVWIGKAYQSSKELGLKRVEDRIGGRKYELQRKMLQAEKDREKGLAAATQVAQQFHNQLAAEQEALAGLERKAQNSFKAYSRLQRNFQRAYETAEGDCPPNHERLLVDLRTAIGKGAEELGQFQGFTLLRLLRYAVLWFLIAGAALGLVPLAARFGFPWYGWPQAAAAACGWIFVVVVLRFISAKKAEPLASSISRSLARARHVHEGCQRVSEEHYQAELARVQQDYVSVTQGVDQQLKQTLGQAGDLRVACRMKTDERAVRAQKANERNYQARLQRLEREHVDLAHRALEAADVHAQALKNAWEQKRAELAAARKTRFQTLEQDWQARIQPLFQVLGASIAEADATFPDWKAPVWREWKPPAQFVRAARFGALNVDIEQLCAGDWKEKGLQLPGSTKLTAPLCLAYPELGSVLFETSTASGHDQAVSSLNNLVLRLLSTAPPGRLNFTILDPVGLGQNFAGIMHLADFEEQLINNRIWTQSLQIEQKLAELNEHMEKVIQMYLRNEYRTIAEYNEQAGVIAEKYHFLVIADFPANFSDVAIKRLMSIAASGARCGVFMLLHWDHRHAAPQELMPEDLRKSAFTLTAKSEKFAVGGRTVAGMDLVLEDAPPAEVATDFIQAVGRHSRDSSRVEVPFEHVAPAESEVWSEDTSSELRVAIGRTGATKLQYLEIGKGTRQHGLVAGKTGSGKSTLFHVIITNLALWCSPEQVEFYLVDFKKGVEFKCYGSKRLPHARVVAIESDREFALSVLQRVDDELRRRGDLFRQLGVQDVAGYKRAGGKEPIPRTLLLIDEFQEYFVEDDKIAQTASLLLDRIVRQGRAFGIHVLLGSQTLGGAYTVARTTLGQMVIRVALQCNEADAYLIMDDNNPAPRLLSRPGEGIYNDMAGAIEGNSPFQVVWLPEAVRDAQLTKVRARADSVSDAYPGPIVFEGNAPADVQENPILRKLLESGAKRPVLAGKIWLGAPNSIKGPTEAVFHRQSGSNLLIVGQRDEAILAIFSIGLTALAAQFGSEGARMILCDATPPGTAHREFLDQVLKGLEIRTPRVPELPALMQELGVEFKARSEAADPEAAPPVFLFINGLQKFSKLRYEEDFSFSSDSEAPANPGAILHQLICEGSRLGFHVIASCDTYNNVSRFLNRKALSEFEMRVLFQMSANDSASLIDNPKAGMLGLHRALFFNAHEGYLETFRPYALPPASWLEYAQQRLTATRAV